jgi:hypothetical protein
MCLYVFHSASAVPIWVIQRPELPLPSRQWCPPAVSASSCSSSLSLLMMCPLSAEADTTSSRDSTPDSFAWSPPQSPTPASVRSPSPELRPHKAAQKTGKTRSTTPKATRAAAAAAVEKKRRQKIRETKLVQDRLDALLLKKGRPADGQVLSFLTKDFCRTLLEKHASPEHRAFTRSRTG